MIRKNIGTADRVLRSLCVIAVGVLFFLDAVPVRTRTLLGLLAVGLLFSSLTGFSPLYHLLRWSTHHPESPNPEPDE